MTEANPPSTPTRRTAPPAPRSCGCQAGPADARGPPRATGTPEFGCWEGPWGLEGTGGAGMPLVPWAVGAWGNGLTEGKPTWGQGLVAQPRQGSSSLLQSPSGPSSRSSEGPRAGASPQPATPREQGKPTLAPRGGLQGRKGRVPAWLSWQVRRSWQDPHGVPEQDCAPAGLCPRPRTGCYGICWETLHPRTAPRHDPAPLPCGARGLPAPSGAPRFQPQDHPAPLQLPFRHLHTAFPTAISGQSPQTTAARGGGKHPQHPGSLGRGPGAPRKTKKLKNLL